jgi:NADH dehydrogenase (ubiquinone) 1 alpha subcomplex subunit 6
MALRALIKADTRKKDKSSVAQLYRSIIKELPRVMTIYDIDMPFSQAKAAIIWHFRKNSRLKDGNVIGLLLAKGYMEVEETLMQWKQKTHLLRILEPLELQPKKYGPVLTAREKLILNIDQ